MSTRPLLIFRTSAIPYPGNYVWRAAVNSDVDGDSVWVERDSGCRSSDLIEIRITGANWKGFNADERFTPGGKLVTAEVRRMIPDWSIVRIETKPDTEKYGRWLSPILIPVSEFDRIETRLESDYLVQREEQKGAVLYVDLAAYLVGKFPEAARWQTY